MINQLSLCAYDKEVKSGRLGKRRKMVYDILKVYGKMTNKMILKMAQLQYPRISINQITGRTRDLVIVGMVECKGTIKDADTGHTVNLWGITGRTIPLELPNKPNKDKIIQKLREEVASLRDRVEELNKPIW